MKIGFFSDTHAKHKRLEIPDVDMLIFGGDCMTDGYSEYELLDFMNWYNSLKVDIKIMIAGNHDRFIENYSPIFKDYLIHKYKDIIYLENSGVEIDGINIYGIPDSHFFFGWAFNRSSEQLEMVANAIPDDTNILVTHAPAYGILDQLERGERVGEPEFTERIKDLKHLKYHLSGHIHCSFGNDKTNSYTAINGSVVDERYYLVNPITVFEYGK